MSRHRTTDKGSYAEANSGAAKGAPERRQVEDALRHVVDGTSGLLGRPSTPFWFGITVELLQIIECQAREQLAQFELLYNEAPLGLCYMDTHGGLSPSHMISQLWDHENYMSTSSHENNRGRYS